MSARSSMTVDESKSVVFIITHTIKAGNEQRYEDWTREILRAVSSFPGYLGREVFLPSHGNRKYTIIVRFDTTEHLNNWAESETRKEFISRVRNLLEKGDQYEIRTGIDFWFSPEGMKPPKPWKQFLVTVSAIYPLTLIVPRLLTPIFRKALILEHQLISGLIIAAVIVGLMTFVIMPRYTRLVKRWLYEIAK